ncbi:hypothetical protein NNC19_13325 [Clostridium sp. SHJSY1]|uniref:hypothetical protein n=1 Tax=Clostridium sp. SHJSY1 TaxID=2942483 RepID=UPI002875165A|nr:hypothetical protein [Clostridium sp. SHJSY1]MDS0526667.1 hypothetical protein [Clostridium sp. SHJSY1]
MVVIKLIKKNNSIDNGFIISPENEKIKKACSILEVISKDDIKRPAYEAREAELHDQATKLKSAIEQGLREGREKGRAEGINEAKRENAKNLLLIGIDVELISKGIGLTVEEVEEIKKSLN